MASANQKPEYREPEHDMDGGHYHSNPTPEQEAAYEESQRQSNEWASQGRCCNCGSCDVEGNMRACSECLDEMYGSKS